MHTRIAPWSKVPLIRLLIPFIAGIILQCYLAIPIEGLLIISGFSCTFVFTYFLLPFGYKFRYRILNGINIQLLFIMAGAMVTWKNLSTEFLLKYQQATGLHVYKIIVTEPPVIKPNSIKLTARVQEIPARLKSSEKTLVYLQKSAKALTIRYGSIVVLDKELELVKNSGNPGSFDYKRYCSFNGISYQCYLRDSEYSVAPKTQANPFKEFIFSCTDRVLSIIKKYIPSSKEQGLAEALLIGYKNDLDKDLVQAYANTGVVHVIAISGLHLGLIYGLLLALTRPIKKYRALGWCRLIIIITGLWLFSIMAGAQPSVLRSAIMFTCIALGEGLSKKTSIYNSLALSAFLVLCYNPFWLWDAGFQLSYAAVLSIISFYRPLYNCLYFKNKIIDMIWQLSAVTLSAQLLTLPVSIYHFHQFPVLFYFTNIVAVPLSSIILIGEILLCTCSFIPGVAFFLGDVLTYLIKFMNQYVERFNLISIAVIDHLSIDLSQALLLTTLLTSVAFWLMKKTKTYLWTAMLSVLFFLAARSYSFYNTWKQRKLIVYNLPGKKAVELIKGHNAIFLGDSMVIKNKLTYNFNIYPSHVLYRLGSRVRILPLRSFRAKNDYFLVLDGKATLPKNIRKAIFIITGKKRLEINEVVSSIYPVVVIIDATVPKWKSASIKKILDAANINHHDVGEKGAFQMDL